MGDGPDAPVRVDCTRTEGARVGSIESLNVGGRPNVSPLGERPIWISSGILAALLTVLLMASAESLTGLVATYWPEILFWVVSVALVNLIPVRVHDLFFTLDAPLVLAVALLYPPPVAALIGLVATTDLRELRGHMEPSYALFNRLHTSVTVFLASSTFHLIGGELDSMPQAALGALAALIVDYLANVAFVLAGAVERGGGLRAAARSMKVRNPGVFFGTYLGYGLLAVVLAYLFRTLGGWSVVTFLVPIVVAQQMLMRTQELGALAEDLRRREQLMQNLLDRVTDERKDERLRIAGELHDTVLQSLTKLWMIANVLAKRDKDSSAAAADIEELARLSDGAISELRRLLSEIRQSPLGRGGLVPTLDGLVRDLRLEWQKKIRMTASSDIELPGKLQIVAYQVAREGLMNALQHANASTVWVDVRRHGDCLIIEVRDDGRGFDAGQPSSLHFGLNILRERLEACKGKLVLDTQPGRGTTLRALIPTSVKALGAALS
jgi:signal transduction histidine kinase